MAALRHGVIGLGRIAQKAHLPALAQLREEGELDLVALCDVDAENAAQVAAEFGIARTFTDHHALLDEAELDSLSILIPPTFHTDAELIAAERGIHVLVEKPPTLDMAQARRFADAIDAAGIVSQVGFMSRYYPTAERVRAMLIERVPRHAMVQRCYSGRHLHWWTSKFEHSGGSFVENSIHIVDLLRFFYGDIAAVSAFHIRRSEDEAQGLMDIPHAYLVTYRFASDVVAQLSVSRVLTHAKVSLNSVSLVSDDSVIEWSARHVAENSELVFEDTEQVSPFLLENRAFVRAARAGDPAAVRSPYRDALNSLAAVLAANVSAARDGERVDVLAFQRGETDAR